MNKVTTAQEAIARIKDGDTVLVGGFLQAGCPETLLKALLEMSTATNLTIVSNDTGTKQSHMMKIMEQGRVSKVHASYIGANPLTGQMLIDNPESVTLYPQGTLAEKIRCGGAGIAAFYTPVGVGTLVEEGKEKRRFGDKNTSSRRPCAEGVALVKATVADKAGNCFLRGSTKNFGAIMARGRLRHRRGAEDCRSQGARPELVTIPASLSDALVPSEV